MLYLLFYTGDVDSLKGLPCSEFIDLERPERFGHLVWLPINTCVYSFVLTEIIHLKVLRGLQPAAEGGAVLHRARASILCASVSITA